MNWEDIGNAISKYAPLAAASLTSPIGAAIGAGTLIANLFGVKADPKSVMEYIENNPEKAQEKLQTLELLKENNRSKENIQLIESNDRDSARKRQEIVKDNIPAVVAILFTIGYFSVLFFNKFLHLTDNGINSISAGMMLILAYYFGASNRKN